MRSGNKGKDPINVEIQPLDVYSGTVEIRFTPETEAGLKALAAARGCEVDQLAEKALADYIDKAATTAKLDRRYDEMMNGTVKMLTPEELWANLDQRRAERYAKRT